MTEPRIRWEPTKYGGWTGHVGMLEAWAFQIFKAPPGDTGWSLTTQLPVPAGEAPRAGDPDVLKTAAEGWLEEFAASIGAVFPPASPDPAPAETG